jgi:activating signal cointegrator 1
MKAISIRQPWASLLATGAKRFETRSWQTRHRGPLLLHAGRCLSQARWLAGAEPFRTALHAHRASELCYGAILGCAELVDCLPTEALDDVLDSRERALGDFRPGRWAWVLERPIRLTTPLPLRGVLGIFDVDDALLRRHLTAGEEAAWLPAAVAP